MRAPRTFFNSLSFTGRRHLSSTFSQRPLQPFLLERFDGWNDSTMSLSSSECQALSLQELLEYATDEGKQRWEQLSLGYVEPSQGSEYLRHAILQAQFQWDPPQQQPPPPRRLDPSHVNVCAPQEGIFLTIHALCEPGDHVIVVAPAYQSLHEIASSLGCHVDSWWPTTTTNTDGVVSSWFSPETLQSLIRPGQTKLVVANFPHNPTGALPSRLEFQQMIDIVQDAGAWFLVDEMYRGLEHSKEDKEENKNHNPHPHSSSTTSLLLPAIANCMERGISLGGVSKSYGLPGLRIGWIVNRTESFQKRVAQLKDYTSICPPAPSEVLAFMALQAQEAIWERSRCILADGLPRLRRFVQENLSSTSHHPKYVLEWNEPLGGTFAWVKFQSRDGTMTASEYSDLVRKRTGLMMVPSGLFPECQASDNFLRLTYGKTDLQKLLKIWEQDLQQDC